MVEAKIESYLKYCYYDYDNREWLYVKNDGSFIAAWPDEFIPWLKSFIDDKKTFSVFTPGNHRWSFPIQYTEQPISPLADFRIPLLELTRGNINLYRRHKTPPPTLPVSHLYKWVWWGQFLHNWSWWCPDSHQEWKDENTKNYDQNVKEWNEFAFNKGWTQIDSENNDEPEQDDAWKRDAFERNTWNPEPKKSKGRGTKLKRNDEYNAQGIPIVWERTEPIELDKFNPSKIKLIELDNFYEARFKLSGEMPTQKEIDEWLELRENCILESTNSGYISFWDVMAKFTTPPAKRIKHLSWAMTRCCSEIGCDMKQLAASTVLQRQFRTAWNDIYEQELSKQTLRARIKVAVIDRKKVEAI